MGYPCLPQRLCLIVAALCLPLAFSGPLCPLQSVAVSQAAGGTVMGMQQYGLWLERAAPSSLARIEYATAEKSVIVPFAIVMSVTVSSDGLRCVFVDTTGTLFNVEIGTVTTAQLSPVNVPIEASSVLYAADSSILGFVSSATHQMTLYVANETMTPLRVDSDIQIFQFSSDSEFVVYSSRTTGLIRRRIDQLQEAVVVSNATNVRTFAISPVDASSIAFIVDAELFVGSVMRGTDVDETQFLGWSGDGSAIVYTEQATGRLWLLVVDGESPAIPIAESEGSVQVEIQGMFCLFLGTDGQLWGVYLSVGSVGAPWRVGNASTIAFYGNGDDSVVFLSGPGDLFSSPVLRNDSSSSRLIAAGVDSVVEVWQDQVAYIVRGSGFGYVSNFSGSDEAGLIIGRNVSQMALQQPPAVGVMAMVDGGMEVFTACLVPAVNVESEEVFGSANASGHVFFSNTSVILQQRENVIVVGGSAVLNNVGVQLTRCVNVPLLQANLLVGEVGMVDSFSVAVACGSECPRGSLRQNDSVVWVVIDTNGCDSAFSWTVFGIVVGVSAFIVIVVLVALYFWNRRQVRAADIKLRQREMKYRAIGEDV